MTHTEPNNATQAAEWRKKARDAALSGDETRSHLNQAIGAINESSGRNGIVVEVIDFQAGLLAINAVGANENAAARRSNGSTSTYGTSRCAGASWYWQGKVGKDPE